jgi:hypothetical protein
MKRVVALLVPLLVAGIGYVMIFGLFPQYFDLEWDEEIEMETGKLAVLRVKKTFERRGYRLLPYDENASTMRRNTYTFTTNGSAVVFTTRMPLAYLGELDGHWYAVIAGQGPFGNYPDEMPDHWGRDFTTLEQRLAVLKGDAFTPIAWEAAPKGLVRMNLLPSVPLSRLVSLNGSRVSLVQKRQLELDYPTPYRREITRPLRFKEQGGSTS